MKNGGIKTPKNPRVFVASTQQAIIHCLPVIVWEIHMKSLEKANGIRTQFMEQLQMPFKYQDTFFECAQITTICYYHFITIPNEINANLYKVTVNRVLLQNLCLHFKHFVHQINLHLNSFPMNFQLQCFNSNKASSNFLQGPCVTCSLLITSNGCNVPKPGCPRSLLGNNFQNFLVPNKLCFKALDICPFSLCISQTR